MAHELTTSYLRDSLSLFRYYKKFWLSAPWSRSLTNNFSLSWMAR